VIQFYERILKYGLPRVRKSGIVEIYYAKFTTMTNDNPEVILRGSVKEKILQFEKMARGNGAGKDFLDETDLTFNEKLAALTMAAEQNPDEMDKILKLFSGDELERLTKDVGNIDDEYLDLYTYDPLYGVPRVVPSYDVPRPVGASGDDLEESEYARDAAKQENVYAKLHQVAKTSGAKDSVQETGSHDTAITDDGGYESMGDEGGERHTYENDGDGYEDLDAILNEMEKLKNQGSGHVAEQALLCDAPGTAPTGVAAGSKSLMTLLPLTTANLLAMSQREDDYFTLDDSMPSTTPKQPLDGSQVDNHYNQTRL
jgi:hypothetical protein